MKLSTKKNLIYNLKKKLSTFGLIILQLAETLVVLYFGLFLLRLVYTSATLYGAVQQCRKKISSTSVPKMKILLKRAENLNKFQHIKCGNILSAAILLDT